VAAVVADGVAVVVGIVLTMEGKDKREDEEDYKGHGLRKLSCVWRA
jgi:hypothetical protein